MPESENLNVIPVGPTGTHGGAGIAGLPTTPTGTEQGDAYHSVERARSAYRAYGATTDFKNFQGNPMPAWEELPSKIQLAWQLASRAAGDYRPLPEPGVILQSQPEWKDAADGLTMGEVIAGVQEGKRAARKGWNGKGMFLYYVPAASYAAQTNVAKQTFGDTVPYGAYMAMKTADGNVVPWTPSQTDMFATDWVLFI